MTQWGMRAALVLLWLCSATAATASEWWLVDWAGTKPKRTVIFIDKSSIRSIRGSTKQVWESWFNETVNLGDPWITQKALYEYDCGDRTMSLVSWIRYNRTGESIGSNTIPSFSRKLQPAAPDTVGETTLKTVCGEATGVGPITDFDPIMSAKAVLAMSDRKSPD